MGTAKRRASRTFGALIGARVRELRLAKNISQAELARRVGMRAPKLNGLEMGQSPEGPKPQTLQRIALELGVPIAKILPSSAAANA